MRNQGEIGIQQGFGRWVVADFGYFNKHTDNGYDFGVLFNTPIVFPVAWDHSRINGFTGRVNLVEHGGFSAFVVMAHTNAIFSPPGVGGILLEQPAGDFRIDHDQKFNATTNLQYIVRQAHGAWAALSLAVRLRPRRRLGRQPRRRARPDGDQQAAIGFFCGSARREPRAIRSPAADCTPSNYGATRLRIPGRRHGRRRDESAAHRAAPSVRPRPRRRQPASTATKAKVRVRFSVINLTNKEALYNFLSTFSGTHFVTPRAYQVQLGVTF